MKSKSKKRKWLLPGIVLLALYSFAPAPTPLENVGNVILRFSYGGQATQDDGIDVIMHFDTSPRSARAKLSVTKVQGDGIDVILNQVQDDVITGTVSDSGGPIPGVAVSIKGKNVSTVTDENGVYSIEATIGDILVFNYPGYETVEITIEGQTLIDVELFMAVALEEAVINAGYYTVKDKERTGSTSRVTAEEIENQPVGNVLSAIQGRMTGVSITQNSGVPGSGYEIQIRGVNSLRRQGNYPLYIIDGVPINSRIAASLSGSIIPYGEVNPLNILNPNDIESIEILKDADATAIYGSRGANGVVVITTQEGKAGKTSISFNSTVMFSDPARKMDMLTTEEYLHMRRLAFENDGITELP